MVELRTRGGESAMPLLLAATQLNIPFVSVELDQCPNHDEIKRVDARPTVFSPDG